jgi:cytochrome c-type biogenesis protein CcsB
MSVMAFQLDVLIYLFATLIYFLSLLESRRALLKYGGLTLALAFLFHTGTILSRIVQGWRAPFANLHESLSFFVWCVVGIFFFLNWMYRIGALGIIVSAFASVLMVAALAQDTKIAALPPVLQSYWFPIHGLLSFAGEAIFGLAFAAGVVYLFQEARVKKKVGQGSWRALPSLEVLDDVNYRCLSLGFPLLTAGIVTGSVWASYAWGSYWSWDPKETWSLITWLIYAAFLHQRLNVGWRGRKAAMMAIVGFVSVVFTFLGVNLLFPGLHSYTQLNR